MDNTTQNNIDIFFFGISVLLSIGIFLLAINKLTNTLNKNEEIAIRKIIRITYIIVALYFFITSYNIAKNDNKKSFNNNDKQAIATFFILIATIVNLTINDYEEIIEIY